MRWTIERLRLAIIVVAAVLLVSIVGSIFYGRWRLRQIAQDLPGRLGIQIQQTTQGFVRFSTEGGAGSLRCMRRTRSATKRAGG